ncbi:MAG: hypothetical protein JXR76_24985 [Deltaproteobacteria bacterium]|nr:hypothetical protein [Deltaproteobacteria bacterium]
MKNEEIELALSTAQLLRKDFGRSITMEVRREIENPGKVEQPEDFSDIIGWAQQILAWCQFAWSIVVTTRDWRTEKQKQYVQKDSLELLVDALSQKLNSSFDKEELAKWLAKELYEKYTNPKDLEEALQNEYDRRLIKKMLQDHTKTKMPGHESQVASVRDAIMKSIEKKMNQDE